MKRGPEGAPNAPVPNLPILLLLYVCHVKIMGLPWTQSVVCDVRSRCRGQFSGGTETERPIRI
jgi:hypothetical protein